MITDFSDHAANERTYLAWVRTGLAIVAFGFVVAKFNLFMRILAQPSAVAARRSMPLPTLRSPGGYEGLALMASGAAVIVLATVRFVRTTRLLDDGQVHTAADVRAELIVSAALVLLIGACGLYLLIS